ncbi:MAG: cytochrome c oxidase subunit II [Ignavibacteria bacterium]|nr:cytochrome c oxidase subunit II [Ignavibacteria bacterium]
MRPNIISQTDGTMLFIIACSIILLLLVTVAMIYFCIKYSRKNHPVAENIHGNTTLEVTWTVLPTILVMVMFFYGYMGFKNLRDIPADAYTVKVTGQMWKWTFEYPETKKKSDTLYVPVGKDIKMEIHANDVNHSFFIPALRVKEDAVPGRTNYLWFNAEKEGRYDIACAEYCGMNHSYMYAVLMVIPQQKFDDWVKVTPAADTTKKATDSLKTTGKDSLKTSAPAVDTTKKEVKQVPDATKKEETKKDSVKK